MVAWHDGTLMSGGTGHLPEHAGHARSGGFGHTALQAGFFLSKLVLVESGRYPQICPLC